MSNGDPEGSFKTVQTDVLVGKTFIIKEPVAGGDPVYYVAAVLLEYDKTRGAIVADYNQIVSACANNLLPGGEVAKITPGSIARGQASRRLAPLQTEPTPGD